VTTILHKKIFRKNFGCLQKFKFKEFNFYYASSFQSPKCVEELIFLFSLQLELQKHFFDVGPRFAFSGEVALQVFYY
jgi:hypothetical protein